MKTITIHITDEEYARLMQKAYLVKADCETRFNGSLKPAKDMLTMCALLNLEKNMDMFAKAVLPE